VSSKSKSKTFLLCYFFGVFGIHRFYLGKLLTGVLMLVTGGGFVVWWLIDLFRIVSGRFKDKQGGDLRTTPLDGEQTNAGFWVRLSAFLVDGLVLGLIVVVFIELPLFGYLLNTGMSLQSADPAALAAVVPIFVLASSAITLLYVGYFVALTAGKHQGTYGKRSMGIYVRSRSGDRIWIGGSLVRFVGYIISSIPLCLGFLMVAFQKNKLALHDLIAGTEVVFGTPSEEAASVEHDAVTEVLQPDELPGEIPDATPEPAPAPAGFDEIEVRPSRVPEILVGTGLVLIVGAMALSYMR
jgi:uncharacterized RDD family membrane protein YckC